MAKHSILRTLREAKAKLPAQRLATTLGDFYASHYVGDWQRKKVEEIRAVYNDKQIALDSAHNVASSALAEEFMMFELEYLKVSDRLKEENGGKEPYHKDIRALISGAFWKQLGEKISDMTTAHAKEA